MPVKKLNGIPVRGTAIEVGGRPVVLRNMRRFGVPEHLQPPASERDVAVHGLMAVFRDGHGHGGQFKDAHEWDDALLSVKEHSVESDETRALKGLTRALYQEMRLTSYEARLAQLNGFARQETGLWVAFEHPENHDRHVMALARVAGVALDDTHPGDFGIGLMVEGHSALEGDRSGGPLAVPLPRARAFPFIEVT